MWTSQKSIEILELSLKWDKNKGSLQEDQYIISIIFNSFLPGMKNISDRCLGKIETYI
jgi:hypothetical protein